MSTGKPSSFRVAEVTGPIDANLIPSLALGGILPASIRKFLTVDELVNVTTFGRFSELFRSARSRERDFAGTTVS
jgi:hypothetical protein